MSHRAMTHTQVDRAWSTLVENVKIGLVRPPGGAREQSEKIHEIALYHHHVIGF